MVDPRVKKLSKILIGYSLKIKSGEKIVISGAADAEQLIKELYRLVLKKGAIPILDLSFDDSTYDYYKLANKKQLGNFPKHQYELVKNADAVIRIYSPLNTRMLTNIDPKKVTLRNKILKKIKDEMLKKRWVLVAYPTNALAQEADMSLSEFQDFVYKATNIDWEKKKKEMEKIKKRLDGGNTVRIVGKDTDITFSIKGRRGIVCAGEYNMPDGEVFYSPIETTTNGKISFSFPTIMQGREVDRIVLEFMNGKVIRATATKNEKFLKEMLNADAGAKYLGEFGIGLNYRLKKHIKNILFDEKLGGTIHLALGNAYPEAQGTNKSSIHWDLIKDLRKEGKVYLDGDIVFEKGRWRV